MGKSITYPILFPHNFVYMFKIPYLPVLKFYVLDHEGKCVFFTTYLPKSPLISIRRSHILYRSHYSWSLYHSLCLVQWCNLFYLSFHNMAMRGLVSNYSLVSLSKYINFRPFQLGHCWSTVCILLVTTICGCNGEGAGVTYQRLPEI